jgi:hypothetical protein
LPQIELICINPSRINFQNINAAVGWKVRVILIVMHLFRQAGHRKKAPFLGGKGPEKPVLETCVYCSFASAGKSGSASFLDFFFLAGLTVLG